MKELSKKKKIAMCVVLACSMVLIFLGIGLNNCSPNSYAGKINIQSTIKYTYNVPYGETKEVYFSCYSGDTYYVYVDNASLRVLEEGTSVSTSYSTSSTYYGGKYYDRKYIIQFETGKEYALRFTSNSNSNPITFVVF